MLLHEILIPLENVFPLLIKRAARLRTGRVRANRLYVFLQVLNVVIEVLDSSATRTERIVDVKRILIQLHSVLRSDATYTRNLRFDKFGSGAALYDRRFTRFNQVYMRRPAENGNARWIRMIMQDSLPTELVFNLFVLADYDEIIFGRDVAINGYFPTSCLFLQRFLVRFVGVERTLHAATKDRVISKSPDTACRGRNGCLINSVVAQELEQDLR